MNASGGGGGCFIPHFCKFLILLVNASGNWKRTKCASDFHGFEHTQITTVESGLRGAEKCNIVAIFQIGLSGTPARNLTEEIRSPGVVPVSGNVAEYR
ncbi:TPA: hypothetical protein NUW72_004260 [Escherichia coli]|nr:hypothetical protein [Escherichia coli]